MIWLGVIVLALFVGCIAFILWEAIFQFVYVKYEDEEQEDTN